MSAGEETRTAEAMHYLASRLVTTVLIVLGAMLLLFTLSAVVPGDPATTLLGPQATPELSRRFVTEMGLDQPLPVRLWRFFANALTGNLGTDVISGRSVAGLIGEVLPYTLILTFSAIGLAVAIGVPLGVFAATHRGSLADNILAFVSVAFIAVPSFVIAIFLLLIFAIWLDWLPVLGASRTGAFWDEAKRMILPTLALALGWIGFIARLIRTSMLEVIAEPYIRTSRAFGLSRRLVTYKYALKNACIPTITILGMGVGRLLGGAVLVEIVFARPGLGRLIYQAISERNYPVVQGAVLVVVVLFVAVNLIVDLSYSAIDPRIRRLMAAPSTTMARSRSATAPSPATVPWAGMPWMRWPTPAMPMAAASITRLPVSSRSSTINNNTAQGGNATAEYSGGGDAYGGGLYNLGALTVQGSTISRQQRPGRFGRGTFWLFRRRLWRWGGPVADGRGAGIVFRNDPQQQYRPGRERRQQDRRSRQRLWRAAWPSGGPEPAPWRSPIAPSAATRHRAARVTRAMTVGEPKEADCAAAEVCCSATAP